MSVQEFSSFRRDDDIAGERDLEPGGDREPVNCSDDGLSAPLHLGNGVGLHVLHIALENVLGGGEINAGTKHATGPRQNDDPDRFLLI